jgi:hypothetical protein
MKFNLGRLSRSAFALAWVMIFTGATLLTMAGLLRWSSMTTSLTRRNNQVDSASAAAEAAVEKVVAQMSEDFQQGGETRVFGNLLSYRESAPTSQESDSWSSYEFSDGQGHVNQTSVELIANWSYSPLEMQFKGLKGNTATYRIISHARQVNSAQISSSGVKAEFQIASIPIVQYQVFSALDLEINPGLIPLNIGGRVHCNGTIYTAPLQPLGTVTASGQIFQYQSPADPVTRILGTVIPPSQERAGVKTLNLPIGTNNSSVALHSIIEVPPVSESPGSPMGSQRYYNKADLIILVSNGVVAGTSGSYNGFSIMVAQTNLFKFLNTNVTFFNKRENKTILTSEVDITKFKTEYSNLKSLLGRDIKTLYIADRRSQSSGTESGVRLINGQVLPVLGLTVATLNPLYVKGHYNAPSSYVGTTNTSTTVPASLVADAITILSGAWADNNSGSNMSSRKANDTTINAAMVSGIVPSGNGYYSGGLENFRRLLEDWTGRTFTFNGSVAALFRSQIATAPWGASTEVYLPPTRNWSFDPSLTDTSRQPPGTPEVRTSIRASWATD